MLPIERSVRQDSNLQPQACQACALPLSYVTPFSYADLGTRRPQGGPAPVKLRAASAKATPSKWEAAFMPGAEEGQTKIEDEQKLTIFLSIEPNARIDLSGANDQPKECFSGHIALMPPSTRSSEPVV